MNMYSDWWGSVEDLQAWSSPATASTPTIASGTESISVFDHIHAAVHTRSLAIPHPKNAIEACALEKIGLLATPY